MSLLLRIIAWRTPRFILKRELDAVAYKTIDALESLIKINIKQKQVQLRTYDPDARLSLQDRRFLMAQIQNEDVAILVDVLGREEATTLARPVLYKIGKNLGSEVKSRLAVKDSINDLLQAATILYRVLGIDFSVEHIGKKIQLRIHRCMLAMRYTSDACRLLSAVDEGVVEGLSPKIRMSFIQRMTDNCDECLANIFEFTHNGKEVKRE